MNYNSVKRVFKKKIPTNTLCSDSSSNFSHKHKGKALGMRLIQHNAHNLVCFLTVDIDHDNAGFEWSDQAMPAPNIVVLNKYNGKGHYTYFLKTPVTKGLNAHPKPLAYAAAVHFNLNHILGGDQTYTNLITKNPFHRDYRSTFITDHLFSLEDLARPAIKRFGKLKDRRDLQAKSTGIGRNQDLFDTLRHWGYRAVHEFKESGSFPSWFNEATAQAAGINSQFNPPLPENEVRHTVRSVAEFCWFRYRGDGKRRGVMNLESAGLDLDLSERRSMGAAYTAQVKRKTTEERIINAIGQLTAAGKRVSKAAVARTSGVGRRTIYNDYTHLFHD